MRLADLNADDVGYVVRNMRAWDRREAFACRWHGSNDDDIANSIMSQNNFGFVAGVERPICAIGCIPMWPGVWQAWMLATDEWPRISTSVTKFTKRTIIPTLAKRGAHRIECRTMEGHPSGRWLEWLGAKRIEEPLRAYGRNRENFFIYGLEL